MFEIVTSKKNDRRIWPDRSVTRFAIDAPSARCVPQQCHQAERRHQPPTVSSGASSAAVAFATTTGASALVPVADRLDRANSGRQHTVHETAAGPHMMKGVQRAHLMSSTLLCISSRVSDLYVCKYKREHFMYTHEHYRDRSKTNNTQTTNALPICILRKYSPNCNANIVRLPCPVLMDLSCILNHI